MKISLTWVSDMQKKDLHATSKKLYTKQLLLVFWDQAKGTDHRKNHQLNTLCSTWYSIKQNYAEL